MSLATLAKSPRVLRDLSSPDNKENTVSEALETPAETATAKPAKTRGNGPITATYTNAGGANIDRPVNPLKLTFKVKKTGETFTLDIEALSIETLRTLAAQQAFKHVETYVRNHEKDDGATIIGLVEKRGGEVQRGEIYARANSGAPRPERVIDVSPWVDAMELAYTRAKKPLTPDDLSTFRAKLLGMNGLERNKLIANIKSKSPVYAAALLEVQTKLAKAKAKAVKEEVNFDELFA